MNGSGFDWLNLSSSNQTSGSNTPAPPPVSFGSSASNAELNTNGDNVNRYMFNNSLADQLPKQTTVDDMSIPISLKAQDLTLEESKTYMRWYSDILARTNSRTITMNDVYQFLNNFKLAADVKDKLNKIFGKILNSINIGEFFALLRLVSHSLNGSEPSRKLIQVQASVPTPPSILSKKRQNDETDIEDDDKEYTYQKDEKKPLDLDSFTQFMLTGQKPGERTKKKSKKLKSVKFSDQVVTDIHTSVGSPIASPVPSEIDYSLPMDQLLSKLQSGNNLQVPTQSLRVASPDEEEREILRDMESQMNHFQNLNSVDTASIDGVPANIHLHNQEYLKPNMTGPSQMAQMFSPSPNMEEQQSHQLLQPNMTGPAQMSRYYASQEETPQPLQPNITGPADMAKIFAPTTPDGDQAAKVSLLAFTDQMTGNTLDNTIQNSRVTSNGSPLASPGDLNRPLPPPPVPNTRRSRSVSSPTPRISSPLSGNLAVPPVPQRSRLSPSPTPGHTNPPPPPPSRRRGNSHAPPLPAKVAIESTLPQPQLNNPYLTTNNSTSNILNDLKALQEEVDKIRDMTGGF